MTDRQFEVFLLAMMVCTTIGSIVAVIAAEHLLRAIDAVVAWRQTRRRAARIRAIRQRVQQQRIAETPRVRR